MNRTIRSVAVLLGLGFAHATTVALAAPTTFTIDSNLSVLTLSFETSPGSPFTAPQFPGSDTTSLSGTQTVDVTGSTIRFLPTGNVHFALQPAPVAPAIGGAFPGNGPGQYGLLALIPGVAGGPGPGGTGLVAARGLVADSTSGVIPLIGNSFDASQLVSTFVAGTADVNVLVLGTPVVGTASLAGGFANNQLTAGTLTSIGGIETLTVPIFTEAPVVVQGVTVLETLAGQIVATAVVPEPSTLILAAVGGLALLAFGRRLSQRLVDRRSRAFPVFSFAPR
ncbi:MAG: PEP-CTERM sorting domain-containing protein [Planctomycetia bacterium]|nr:PEP-CTERM sorting domain-containing protein [Planctomycetia bacterium]